LGLITCPEERTLSLPDVVERLSGVHGSAEEPPSTDPFELILFENVAYLANDERRAEAMARLRQTVGTAPSDILGATREALAAATGLGILPEDSIRKLRRAAEIAVGEFDGDLAALLDLPIAEAKRGLRRFPGIGEPGAEKILLHCRRHPFLAPDSNALRVLVRLGFCAPDLSYSETYAAARDLARDQLGDDIEQVMKSRHVLRRHGQTTCRRSAPSCEECVLRSGCRFASEAKGRGGLPG